MFYHPISEIIAIFVPMKINQAIYAGSSIRVAKKPERRLPEFAFIGRSNVGKSSLINMLCGQKKLALTSQTPGKTKLINHFLINDQWYLVDLPGYGYAKLPDSERKAIREVIRDYIFNSEDMALLFVLVDSRHPMQKIDMDFIADLGENGIPFSIIFTKGDKLGPVALERQVEQNRQILLESWEELPPIFVSSAVSGKGREEILSYIENVLNAI